VKPPERQAVSQKSGVLPAKCDYAGHSEQPIAGFCVSNGFHKTLVCSPWHRRIFPGARRSFGIEGLRGRYLGVLFCLKWYIIYKEFKKCLSQ